MVPESKCKAMAEEDTSSQQQGDGSQDWFLKHGDWIETNIKQRDCHTYLSNHFKGFDCVCGKSKDEHKTCHEQGTWRKELRTQTGATHFYGTTEIGDGDEVQFVRIDEDTPFKHIKHLLLEVWNIKEPKWILPLIGTKANDLEMEEKLKEAISFVFKKLSTVSELWILSDGLHDGLSGYIADAKADCDVLGERITSIGCSSWAEGLMEKGNDSGSFTYSTLWEEIGSTMSHLMLVDNGTVDQYLCTLSSSSFFTKTIAGLSVPADGSRAIPTVAILFGGELYSLESIRNCVKENIPVIIVKDSSGIADAFCFALEKSKGVSQKIKDDRIERFGIVISQRAKEQLSEMLWEMGSPGQVNEYVQVILHCLQRRDLLSVVDLSLNGSLFQGIMSAIIRTKTSTELISMVDDYLPTPVYSRKSKDKAEIHIENQNPFTYKGYVDSENIVKMVFKEAILQEKSECVEFLLECGVSAVEDLDMLELYKETKNGLQKTVSEIFNKCKDGYEKQQENDNRKVSEMKDNQIIHSFTDRLLEQFVPSAFVDNEQNTDSTRKSTTEIDTDHDGREGKTVGREKFTQLFLWAVLTNRKVVAQQFWTRGQDIMVSALIAGTIMDAIAEKTYNSKKKAVREANASFYRSLTIGTMDACYWDHKKTSVKLIEKRIKDNIWNIDFLALAFESKNSSIFKSEGIVFYTLSKWYGDIPKSTSILKLIGCTLCPAFMFFLLKKKSDTDRKYDSHEGQSGAPEKTTTTKKACVGCSRLGAYYSTPVIKYTSNLLIYCIFLGLYAHFMLIVLTMDFKWNWEIPLLFWMVVFLVEEVIQIAQLTEEQQQRSRKKRREKSSSRLSYNKAIRLHFQNEWNILDCVCVVGFIIGYILRCVPATYDYGRLFLSINCMCFIWRFLQAFTLSKTIGPMLYMMFKMVKDLLPFLVILCVALFSYAVCTEAILYPNSVWTIDFVLQIPVTAFWLIFGELDFLGELETCTKPICPSNIGRRWVPYFTAVYMIMTNVLLLNLIIARFNHIFEEVRGNTDEVWARQRCRLMLEYESKPPVPIPFSILWRMISRLCSCRCKCNRGKMKQHPGDDKTDVAVTPPREDYNEDNCDTQTTDLNIPDHGNEELSIDYSEGEGPIEPPVTILPGQCNISETSDGDGVGGYHQNLEAADVGGDEESQLNEEGVSEQSDTQITETDATAEDVDAQVDHEDDSNQQTSETQQDENYDNGGNNDYYGYYGSDSEVCSDDDMDMEYARSQEGTETQNDENKRKGEMNLDEFERANAELYLHERVKLAN
ncbi:transient receptor potential cation channel subfamily M member-like 2 isoform X1 [Haliotis rufescens]|uniref:transient receptor potential cation channel subfamily M member-like 2 isoform X1 n=2 Tax=Haliotis rufescens TaxID=6454 RepID=UPI001EAFA642|nr:transient receptor potential cation channel subfamily M member-like 2 isoform X1 [Haliotis rufescens]XP_048248279.1 transient receptor potential cation channel subfamily M member-like 2 isoform X1 [Haliotis rufescens]